MLRHRKSDSNLIHPSPFRFRGADPVQACDKSDLLAPDSGDDPSWLPSHGWLMLGGDAFEGEDYVVV